MPGPISDSYDPEWGTAANGAEITEALDALYKKLSTVLSQRPPLFILDLVRMDLPEQIRGTLTEKEWRLIRFSIERARDSI